MPRFLAILFVCNLVLTSALAEDLLVYKVSNKDVHKFLLKKNSDMKQGSKIQVYNSLNKLRALGKIEKCDKTVCLVKVYKKVKGFKLQKSQRVLLIKKQKSQNKSLVKGGERSINKSISLGIGGGPVSFGYNIGYQDCSILNSYCLEFKVGVVDSTLGSVLVSGQYLSLGIHKDIYSSGSLSSYLLGEAGFFKSELDFTEVDSSNYLTEENILFSSVSLGLNYDLSKSIATFTTLGYSINTFKDVYESSSDTYEVGFASSLLILDFGLRYRF